MATKKTAKKKAPAKKAVKKKAPAKKAVAKKAAPKKAAAKKKPVKAVAKKKAPVKKAAAKKTPAKKTATKKTAAKKTATKKAAPAKKAAVKKAPAKKAAAKKPAAKKAAPKKKTAKKAAPPPKPKPRKKANVGQAPRRKTVAASIPVPTQIIPKETPQADAKASEDAQASSAAKQNYKVHQLIVYPAHGVGKIVALERQEVAGIKIELFVINFEQEKMRLRVPTGKAKTAGMRPLSSDKVIKNAIETLKGRARIKRTMWSRRAQEYDAKINSGDIKLVAEVVRDLFRAADQPEQSYSERQLFEQALDRMAREVAAVQKVDLANALETLDGVLQKKAAAAAAATAATAAAAAAATAAAAE
ncbi:MAG: CarD family transcriptional regulator [Alphaproteobacteria bacterium]|nr:CarD family transcriptional regulator [Alphaproteobacteria bacterium]